MTEATVFWLNKIRALEFPDSSTATYPNRFLNSDEYFRVCKELGILHTQGCYYKTRRRLCTEYPEIVEAFRAWCQRRLSDYQPHTSEQANELFGKERDRTTDATRDKQEAAPNSLNVFQGHEVRFIGTAEIPEWVAADVVAVLYPEASKENRANYLTKVPAEWRGNKAINTLGGTQQVSTLLEPGLYWLVARSNSPLALPFQKWVCEQVLPSIRKTGSYEIPKPQPDPEPVQTLGIQETFSTLDKLSEWMAAANVSTAVQSQWKINSFAYLQPQFAAAGKAAYRILQQANPIGDKEPMTASRIAQILNVRMGTHFQATDINKAAEALKWQVQSLDRKWQLTEAGAKFAQVYTATNSRTGWSGGQILWHESALPHFEDYFNAIETNAFQ